jgi:hypothetical protein
VPYHNWRRPLPRPIVIPRIMTLERSRTCERWRTSICRPNIAPRTHGSGSPLSPRQRRVATCGLMDVAVALKMVLQLAGIACR